MGSSLKPSRSSLLLIARCVIHFWPTFPSRGNKDPEFRAWLVEERTINPETLPRDKEKKEFLRFVEDFNTGEPICYVFSRTLLADTSSDFISNSTIGKGNAHTGR
jgi:hypothetical protein